MATSKKFKSGDIVIPTEDMWGEEFGIYQGCPYVVEPPNERNFRDHEGTTQQWVWLSIQKSDVIWRYDNNPQIGLDEKCFVLYKPNMEPDIELDDIHAMNEAYSALTQNKSRP